MDIRRFFNNPTAKRVEVPNSETSDFYSTAANSPVQSRPRQRTHLAVEPAAPAVPLPRQRTQPLNPQPDQDMSTTFYFTFV